MNKTDTLCHMAWDYLMFFPFDPAVGYCCRSPRINLTPDVINQYKQDLFSNLPQFVQRRSALAKGKKHGDCESCWKLEANGFKSPRHDSDMLYYMQKNTGVEFKSISQMLQHPGIEQSHYADCIEMVLNNVCDAKCTYCNEVFSTQWYLEKKKFNDQDLMRVPQDNRNPQLEAYFWDWYRDVGMKHMYRFGFIGGEPFIVDALYEYLEKLIEIHEQSPVAKKELCITSNMNTPPVYFKKFNEFLPKLEKHFKVIIQASGESTGRELEYVRSGVMFDRWKANVEHYLANTNVKLNFLPTLNLLSVPSFGKYLAMWEELSNRYRPIAIFDNIVTSPLLQSPMIAPQEFAVYFDEPIQIVERMLKRKDLPNDVQWSWDVFLRFLQDTRLAISKNKPACKMNDEAMDFYRYFSKLDGRRNTSVVETFPEFTELYELGKFLVDVYQPKKGADVK